MSKMKAVDGDPQWEAAIEYVRQLEKTWGATVSVSIQTDGSNYANTCFVEVVAMVPVLGDGARPIRVREFDRWPRIGHQMVGSLVYYLCHRIDNKIGSELHQQGRLPF